MKKANKKNYVILVIVILGLMSNLLPAQDSVDVTFIYKPNGSNPSSVYLPGEFNGWNIFADRMTYDAGKGIWWASKRLRVGGPSPLPNPGKSIPGAYQYKFNLNGSNWITDPQNPNNNPIDNNNSYLFINDPTIHYLLPNSLSGIINERFPVITAYLFPATSSQVDTGSIRLTIGDKVYENIGASYDPQTSQFSFRPPDPVPNGTNKLKIYAESTTGSISADSTTFRVQAGFIRFLTQKNDRYLRPEQTITGTTDEPDLSVSLVHIGVDTVQLNSDAAGVFSATVPLTEGENQFQAFTSDNNQNQYESDILSITRFVDHAPKPVINISTGQENINFIGVANDPDQDQVSFQWTSDDEINPEPLNINSSQVTFSIAIPATPGEYYLDLVVTDPQTNKGNSRNYFIIDPEGKVVIPDINSNPSWVQDAVVYEIYVPAFTSQGTIAAAQERLQDIKDLGVNVVWFMPIYENGETINDLNAGYNITDFYKVHPQLGTMNDLQNFLAAAHAMGIKVILDSTPNHMSGHHPFVDDIELFRDYSNYRPMFETDLLGDSRDLGQYKRTIGSYTHYVHYSNWGLANIDFTSIEAQDYMLNMYKYWVHEVGIDGYRMDVYWGPHNRYGKNVWWRPFRNEIKRVKPDIFLLGETDGTGTGSENNYADGGGGMDAAYDWALYGEIKTALNGGSIDNLDNRVRNYSPNLAYNHYTGPNAHYFRFIENHDESRFASFASLDQASTAASLLLMIPGVPMIYAGQEIGETSRRGLIDWNRESADEMQAHYAKLLQIRNKYLAIRSNLIKRKTSGNARLYGFIRPEMDENAIVLINFSDSDLTASMSIMESELYLSDTLETDKNYFMNDVYNDTVYTVTKSSLQNFNANLDAWGVRVFILADSAFDDISALPEKLSNNLPEQFSLGQNYPNPFNPRTQIAFSLPERSAVKLIVYDMLGREVARLIDAEMEAGNHSVSWDGRDRNNVLIGSGVYIYKIIGRSDTGELFSQARKMIFLK